MKRTENGALFHFFFSKHKSRNGTRQGSPLGMPSGVERLVFRKKSKKFENKFLIELELLFSKIDRSIEAFKFNVTIAHFYETYNLFNYYLNLEISNKCLIDSITKLMKLLLPITPHIANEILDLLKCNSKNTWPIIRKDIMEEIKFAVQCLIKKIEQKIVISMHLMEVNTM